MVDCQHEGRAGDEVELHAVTVPVVRGWEGATLACSKHFALRSFRCTDGASPVCLNYELL